MRLIYVLVLMLLPILAFSQEEAFYIEFKDIALQDAIEEIEDVYNVLFSYKDDLIKDVRVVVMLAIPLFCYWWMVGEKLLMPV